MFYHLGRLHYFIVWGSVWIWILWVWIQIECACFSFSKKTLFFSSFSLFLFPFPRSIPSLPSSSLSFPSSFPPYLSHSWLNSLSLPAPPPLPIQCHFNFIWQLSNEIALWKISKDLWHAVLVGMVKSIGHSQIHVILDHKQSYCVILIKVSLSCMLGRRPGHARSGTTIYCACDDLRIHRLKMVSGPTRLISAQ